MTTTVESAWHDNPSYQLEVVDFPHTGRVLLGDRVIAESDRCLVVREANHVDKLYFPPSSVAWGLLEPSDGTTVCPFKGQATYWRLAPTPANPAAAPSTSTHSTSNVAWSYATPFPEVADIGNYVSFYPGDVQVLLVEKWPDGSAVATKFPLWGDASELIRLVDVEAAGDGKFIGPAHGRTRRNVVEGGQLLAEAIVAASKTVPDQRVTSASMIFSKAASFETDVDVVVEVLRGGKTFSTIEVRIVQDDSLRSAALILADAGSEDVIRDMSPMPDVVGPEDAVPLVDFSMTGREIRVIGGTYVPDPDRIEPPRIDAWIRFRDIPSVPHLHRAMLAQSTTHWTVAAGMLPHPGFGEANAHATISTGVMHATVAFHDDVDVNGWLLYTNHAFWAGRGLVQGEGRVFTRDGRLAASYSTQAMVRAFTRAPDAMGQDFGTVM